MRRFFQVALLALLALLAIAGAGWGWQRWQTARLEPRYGGRSIAEWFPHWWRNRPPAAASTFNGPPEAGPEAVPFLVRELDLEELPEHRLHAWVSERLPARWRQLLPQPYPPRHYRPAILFWLHQIVTRPGGPTAIAAAVPTAGPTAKRRLLHVLGNARMELASVIPALGAALKDPEPAVRRVAGRSLLRLPPGDVEPALPELLHAIESDTGNEGIAAWSPWLARLADFRGHDREILQALQPWVARQNPEALVVTGDIRRRQAVR